MRLIDADKLIDELNDAQIEFDENYKGLGKAKGIVSLQPTIEREQALKERDLN